MNLCALKQGTITDTSGSCLYNFRFHSWSYGFTGSRAEAHWRCDDPGRRIGAQVFPLWQGLFDIPLVPSGLPPIPQRMSCRNLVEQARRTRYLVRSWQWEPFPSHPERPMVLRQTIRPVHELRVRGAVITHHQRGCHGVMALPAAGTTSPTTALAGYLPPETTGWTSSIPIRPTTTAWCCTADRSGRTLLSCLVLLPCDCISGRRAQAATNRPAATLAGAVWRETKDSRVRRTLESDSRRRTP